MSVVSLVLVAAALAFPLGSDASRASTTLNVVSFYPEGSASWDNLVAIDKSFEASHPGVSVNLIFGGGQNTPNIQAEWRAGDPPEVNVGFFGPGETGTQYVKAGQVYDLTKAMNTPLPASAGYGKNTKWKDIILPSVRPYLTYNGHYYGYPDDVTAITFFYNQAIFAKYGLKPPSTWAQFLAVCAKLKKNGVSPLTVTGTFGGYMQMYYDYLLARRSGTAAALNAIAGKQSFSSVPGAVPAAEDLQTLVQRGYFLKGFQGTDFTAAQLDFFQGKAAMILMGTWLEGEMAGSIPSNFQLGTFPFPSIPGGKGNNVLFGAVNDLTVAAKSANPALGVEWLKWYSRKDVQAARVKYLQYLSPFKGVPAGPKYGSIYNAVQTGQFSTDYLGIYSQPTSVQQAYQNPLTKLFFGQISASEMVKEIATGLQSAQR